MLQKWSKNMLAARILKTNSCKSILLWVVNFKAFYKQQHMEFNEHAQHFHCHDFMWQYSSGTNRPSISLDTDSSTARPGSLHLDMASDRRDLMYAGFIVHKSFNVLVLL